MRSRLRVPTLPVLIVFKGPEVTNPPYFVISTHPVGWRCSQCGEILKLPIMDRASAESDPEMQAAFRAHDCNQYREQVRSKPG